jgi:hypothetical protein
MPLDLEQLLKLFDEHNVNPGDNITKNRKKLKKCKHKFIPMFNSISCEFCGIDKDKTK